MTSERIQRQIEDLLDEAGAAVKKSDWALVKERASQALTMDPENADGLFYLAAAERGLTAATSAPEPAPPSTTSTAASTRVQPTSFVNGRYTVIRFLGEGGKKIVYLCKDTLLNREVAFALIKLEGLDEVGRQRILREAQDTA
ncbi:MAG: hypothetical protein EXR50_04120, partial [Dehalococcoidia bacterium]|nr:hypothetical protein [Dehalococcoidia bacterium]